MPGIALGDKTALIFKSSWLAFIGCAIPALVAGKPGIVTLAADAASGWKTPDATQNPAALFLGCTAKGWAGQGSANSTEEFCDEFTTPVLTSRDQQTFVYESDLLTMFDEQVAIQVYGLEKLHADADTFKHYRIPISSDAPGMTFLLVTRQLVAGVYKYKYLFAPNAKQTASFGQGNYTRTEMFRSKLRMEFQTYSSWATTHTIYEEE